MVSRVELAVEERGHGPGAAIATAPRREQPTPAARAVALAGALGLAWAAGCSDPLVVAPVVDAPRAGSPADPYPSLDTIELALGLAGGPILSSVEIRRGEPLELPDVPYGEALVLHMTGRIGGSEVAYGRTCPFAIRAGEDAPSPHLYFSRTVKWADAAMPSEPARQGGLAITAPDGSALFLGGAGGDGAALTAIDRFDPVTGEMARLADVAARQDSRASLLGGGRLLVAGGRDEASGQPAGYLELVEADATPERRVERVAAAALAVTGHAIAALSDGRVVVFGGRDGGGLVRGAAVEVQSEGAGVSVRALPSAMNLPREQHAATRLSDALGALVLISGGRDAGGQLLAVPELYRPLTDSFAPAAEVPARLVVPRRDHQTARLADDSVLLVGGFDAAGAPVRGLEVFSLERGFVAAGLLPLEAGVTGQTITTLPDRRLLLTGGRDASGAPVASAFIARVDPLDGSIDLIATDSLSAPRAGHQATLLCDGTVLLVGGTSSGAPAERYNPPSSGRR